MTGKAAGRESDQIEAHGLIGEIRAPRAHGPSRGLQAPPLGVAHRLQGLGKGAAALHLHHRDNTILQRQKIDLGLSGAQTKAQEAIALGHQPEGAEKFAPPPGAPVANTLADLGRFHGVRDFKARARA